ncbi:MAG: DNA polymerase III subunit delta [Ilumatobacteraceae bacterium]
MSVHLLTGDDESILRAAVSELVHELVGDADRSLMVDEFDTEDVEVRAVVDAAQTPPFLTERRVVVLRDVGRFSAEDVAPLVAYLADPLPTTELVLVGGGGRLAKSLTDAAKAAGAPARNTTPPMRARDRQAWIAAEASSGGIKLSGAAANAIAERLGEDVGRLDGILQTLAATYGGSRQLGPDDVEPFLGEGGGVPPWELTDAIDGGRTATALGLLARMTGPGGRHPLQLMAVLHGHYGRLARLDGADAASEAEAAAVLGIKPGFPARKALDQYRRLGGGGVQRAIDLLAAADLDLRGARDLPDDVVMDVLVARLSRLGR